jgi:hypothetical protein
VGAGQLAQRLTDACNALVPADVTDTQKNLGLAGALTATGALPATVLIDAQSHPVIWSNASKSAAKTAFATLSVSGWTNDAYVDGKRQLFAAKYEIVPAGLAYYIDFGVTGSQPSPQYSAVAGLQPLKNTSADLTAGFNEWWGMSRPMSQSIIIGATSVAGKPVSLAPGSTATGSMTFTLTEPTTVTCTVVKTGS